MSTCCCCNFPETYRHGKILFRVKCDGFKHLEFSLAQQINTGIGNYWKLPIETRRKIVMDCIFGSLDAEAVREKFEKQIRDAGADAVLSK